MRLLASTLGDGDHSNPEYFTSEAVRTDHEGRGGAPELS